jgi:hypothetical protein
VLVDWCRNQPAAAAYAAAAAAAAAAAGRGPQDGALVAAMGVDHEQVELEAVEELVRPRRPTTLDATQGVTRPI